MSCSNIPSNKVEDWSEKEINEWFDSGEWLCGWEVTPDKTINKKEFAIQFYKNKKRWETAFKFLASNKPATLKLGKYELDGENLFAAIDEYPTKNEEDARFEAHRKYADIQYIVSGEEKIGVTKLKNTKITESYNKSKDIAFLTAPDNNYRLANPKTFFIFFPDDAHRPCVKTGENSTVRKVVIKVRIN